MNSTSAQSLTIRPAARADVGLILQLIRELAEYEREPDSAIATEEDLLRDGFDTPSLRKVSFGRGKRIR